MFPFTGPLDPRSPGSYLVRMACLSPAPVYHIPCHMLDPPPHSLLPRVDLRTRRLRTSYLSLATPRTKAKLSRQWCARETRMSPLFEVRQQPIQCHTCVDVFFYQFGRFGYLYEEPHATTGTGLRVIACVQGVPICAALSNVIHCHPLLSFQFTRVGRDLSLSTLVPAAIKTPDVSLVGKFLWVSLTINL